MPLLTGKIQIVVGAQYGSEAKGAIAAYLCQQDDVAYAVRTGATNAGHTVVYNGDRYAMQQLPCGWVNPNTRLVLGPGALIDLEILKREIAMVNAATADDMTVGDVTSRLYIDPRAYIHRSEHRTRSTESGRHHAMGATGKGCSEALVERIRGRGAVAALLDADRYVLFEDVVGKLDWIDSDVLADTEELLNREYDHGATIQLEGTQGQMLDLYLGPYPYTTHKQTGPAQWLLEAGLSPNMDLDIVMVARTFPIRVAGNSGPLPYEISWPVLAREINDMRTEYSMSPIVDDAALSCFENAVRFAAASRRYSIPFGSAGMDQHEWVDRYRYRMALSELNKDALETLHPDTVLELRKLFEMTTVTKKLRRVARLDPATLQAAARQIRPTRVALTFMNYAFPQRWYTADAVTIDEEPYLDQVTALCGAKVTLITRGPDAAHIVQV